MWSRWMALAGVLGFAACAPYSVKVAEIKTITPAHYRMKATTPGSMDQHVTWLNHNASLVCDGRYSINFIERRTVDECFGTCEDLDLPETRSISDLHCMAPA